MATLGRHISIKVTFGLHGTVLTLGTLGFVASTLHREAPLTEGRIVVRFDLLYGKLCCFQRRRCESLEKSFHDGLIDLNTSDVQTVHVAPRNDILAGAVITGHRASAGVMRVEPTTTFSAREIGRASCRERVLISVVAV